MLIDSPRREVKMKNVSSKKIQPSTTFKVSDSVEQLRKYNTNELILQPKNINIYFTDEIVIKKVMNTKIKKAESFNFLRALCALLIIILSLGHAKNNIFYLNVSIRLMLAKTIAVFGRLICFHIPFLWFYTHEKAIDFIQQRLSKFKRIYFD